MEFERELEDLKEEQDKEQEEVQIRGRVVFFILYTIHVFYIQMESAI